MLEKAHKDKLAEYQESVIKDPACAQVLSYIQEHGPRSLWDMPLIIAGEKTSINTAVKELESKGLLKISTLPNEGIDYRLTNVGEKVVLLTDSIKRFQELESNKDYEEMAKVKEVLGILYSGNKLTQLQISDKTYIPIYEPFSSSQRLPDLLSELLRFGFIKQDSNKRHMITPEGKVAYIILANHIDYSDLRTALKQILAKDVELSLPAIELLRIIDTQKNEFYKDLQVNACDTTGANTLGSVLERLTNARLVEKRTNGFLIEVTLTEDGKRFAKDLAFKNAARDCTI